MRRGHDHAERTPGHHLAAAHGADRQIVIAESQVLNQRQFNAHHAPPGQRTDLAWIQAGAGFFAMNDGPFFIRETPGYRDVLLLPFLQRGAECPLRGAIPLLENENRIAGLLPGRLVQGGQFL